MSEPKYKVGDKVEIDGYTSFCDPYVTVVKAIRVRYNSRTGKPYNVVVTCDGGSFREDDGSAVSGASMYFLAGLHVPPKKEPKKRKKEKTVLDLKPGEVPEPPKTIGD